MLCLSGFELYSRWVPLIWVVMPFSYQVKKFTGHGGGKYTQYRYLFAGEEN